LKNYSPYQFAFFRIILGTYLVFHFGTLIPYAAEIWSSSGILPEAELNLTHGFFPNILNLFDSPLFVQYFVTALTVLAVLFLFGIQRQIVSLLIWYGWVCLFDRNNLISNPGIPFVGWILLCCAVIPKGEPLSMFTKKNEEWTFPVLIFWGAWAIMAISYSISGFDKLNSPSWRDGSAIIHLLNNPLARDWSLRTFLLTFPGGLLHFLTWTILFVEIAFLPLAIWNKTRKWIWLVMIFMHLGILLIVDFADLTLGMLMIHWFTFDPSWLKPTASPKQNNIVFFDGICSLCNAFVDFLIKEDKSDVLMLASLQGETAAAHIKNLDPLHLKTVVFMKGEKLFTKSDAVIEVFRSMGGFWKLTAIFKIIPRFLRDRLYDFVSKNRIKWFGNNETCIMPKEEEKGKLLR
jgi:predicted DCC family thiol-disulfide oxidoreductase YuxK